jgi:hypothetical protein
MKAKFVFESLDNKIFPSEVDAYNARRYALTHGIDPNDYSVEDYLFDKQSTIKIPPRSEEKSKFSVWVFEHASNFNLDKFPKYVWTFLPDLANELRDRNNLLDKLVIFDGKIVPSKKWGPLVPYGTNDKTSSRAVNPTQLINGKRLGGKNFFSWDEWDGKDKFGKTQTTRTVDKEVDKIKKNGLSFSDYLKSGKSVQQREETPEGMYIRRIE